jgi:AraC-like DNA-binding protein
MTITLKMSELEELWTQNKIPPARETPSGETLFNTPRSIGSGGYWEIELDPEFLLTISDIHSREHLRVKTLPHNHPIEFGVLLSGCVTNSDDDYWDSTQTLILGGGIQRETIFEYRRSKPFIGINIQLSPNRLASLFPGEDGQITPELEFLVKENDWQSIFYPPNTAEITRVVQQIRDCPYRGTIKRMYLQAKALEIMSLQLAPLLMGGSARTESRSSFPAISPQLKSQTIAKLHHAQDLIRSRLENPPTSTELSQQLDLSDRTLRRGFRSLFGTTMVGYLTEQRLQQAELLLRNTDRTVADIANYVGYAHLGYFARAFRLKYGINPSDCRSGKAQAKSTR